MRDGKTPGYAETGKLLVKPLAQVVVGGAALENSNVMVAFIHSAQWIGLVGLQLLKRQGIFITLQKYCKDFISRHRKRTNTARKTQSSAVHIAETNVFPCCSLGNKISNGTTDRHNQSGPQRFIRISCMAD
ncbi:hypothetical protein [Microbulbifer sp. SAOS-129_SWC]|uniref:hypothetical protein n=1 Tax=Microbulbifer sp. SAOS-129_SWC TaxID=3145235 RepID=UPI003217E3B2